MDGEKINNSNNTLIEKSTGDKKANPESNEENTNWCQSVGGIVMKGDQVLLVRHTYGAGKGRLIIPGGYVKLGETPQAAAIREVMEETAITAVPARLAGIRFNLKDWYAVFLMDYVEGTPHSDHKENSEALFMDIRQAVQSPEVPDLTKVLLNGVLENKEGAFDNRPFVSREKHGEYSLYSI